MDSTTPQPLNGQPLRYPDEYLKSERLITLASPRLALTRTGITPPGYPTFPVYGQLIDGNVKLPCYVYEAGRFWESAAWRQFYASTGKTPHQANGN